MRSLRFHAFSLGAIGVLHLVVALPAHAQRFLDTLPASAQGISVALDSVVEPRRLTLSDFELSKDDRSEHTIVGESWRGMLRTDSTGKANYEGDANYLLASNLRWKLLLVHGDLDEAVHPSMTIRVAAALIDAGKRFDMMVFPDRATRVAGGTGAVSFSITSCGTSWAPRSRSMRSPGSRTRSRTCDGAHCPCPDHRHR